MGSVRDGSQVAPVAGNNVVREGALLLKASRKMQHLNDATVRHLYYQNKNKIKSFGIGHSERLYDCPMKNYNTKYMNLFFLIFIFYQPSP